jgi:hypothetical protein
LSFDFLGRVGTLYQEFSKNITALQRKLWYAREGVLMGEKIQYCRTGVIDEDSLGGSLTVQAGYGVERVSARAVTDTHGKFDAGFGSACCLIHSDVRYYKICAGNTK